MKKLLLILLLNLFCLASFAQNNYVDSLTTLIKKSPHDTIRVAYLIKLGKYYYKNDWKKSDSAYRVSLSIAQKVNYKFGESLTYENWGMVTRKLGDYPLAIEYLHKALELNLEMSDSIGMSICNNNLGVLYDELGDYENALKFYLKSNEIDRSIGDIKGVSASLNNIALIYSYMDNFDKAIEVLKESIAIKEEIGNETGLAYGFLNLANMYTKTKNTESAIEHYEKALELYEKNEDLVGVARCYNGLGSSFKYTDREKALEHYKQALEIKVELGDELEIARTKHSIGELYMKMDQNDEALMLLQQAANICKEMGSKDLLGSIYGSLHVLYSSTSDYEGAYEYALKYISMQDSLMDGDKFSTIAELQTKYETDKNKYEKDLAEAKSLQAEEETKRIEAVSDRKSTMLYAAVIGFLLVGGLVIMVYRSNRLKKKANEELQFKNDLIRQKNKDITSSIEYAKHIQDSILPSNETIQKMFPNSFVLFEPRDIVSGDFYWFHDTADKTFFAAADCTGHGVPGALVSMVCSNAINHVVVQEGELSSDNILTKLNQEVLEKFRKEESIHQAVDGMDIALCSVERINNEVILNYSGAMNALYIMREESIEEIRADRQAIGGRTPVDYQFTKHTLKLEKGNRVFVFSDGMIDQFGGAKGKKLLSKRFKKLLEGYRNVPISEIQVKLRDELYEWQGDYKRIDDVLVIGIEI